MAEINDRIRVERLERAARGPAGAVMGQALSWVEEPYPTATDETCAVLRMRVNGDSKVVAYITPDGQFHTVGV